MNLKRSLCVTIVTMMFFVAAGTAAESRGSGNAVIHYDATAAGSHLASGSYNIEWQTHSPEATVTFFRGHNVMATAEGKVVDRGTTYPSNQVVYNENPDGSRTIQEIRFKGSSEVIVFNE